MQEILKTFFRRHTSTNKINIICYNKEKGVLLMEKEYLEAIQKIKNMRKIVSVNEWNKIAKEENLLSTESLKYISGKDFRTLQIELRAS